jgi:hypothetical protein
MVVQGGSSDAGEGGGCWEEEEEVENQTQDGA